MGAIQRLMAPDDVRIVVSGLALDPDAAVDGGVGDLWVAVDLAGVPKQAAAALRCRRRARRRHRRSISRARRERRELRPLAQTRAQRSCSRRWARRSTRGGSGEAAVYFHLKTRDARGLEKEVAPGALDLADLARDGRDAVGVAVALHGAGGRQHALTASVFASELLATLGPAGFGRNDALKIGVGQRSPSPTRCRRRRGEAVYVEVAMKKALPTPSRCRRRPTRAAECPRRSSSSSRRVEVAAGASCRSSSAALAAKEEDAADVFVHGEGARQPRQDRRPGVRLAVQMLRTAKDLVGASVDVVAPDRAVVGALEVSVAALPLLRRARAHGTGPTAVRPRWAR